jgi:hypothetical protein
MPPPTPAVLACLLSLQTALRGITIASGYFNDVASTSVVLDPQDLSAVPASACPFLMLDTEKGTIEYGTSRPVAVKNDFLVPLLARLESPGANPDRKRIAAWQFYADVERAVAADPQRGGVAMFTYVQWPTFYFGLLDETDIYLEIPVRVLLQRTFGVA